ncbi:unnamed protein product [Amoebophrya sp. A25]|nr:unnamed protein product [Amoebophrya sp. A25]|eukprot:GSA25T00019930001.1
MQWKSGGEVSGNVYIGWLLGGSQNARCGGRCRCPLMGTCLRRSCQPKQTPLQVCIRDPRFCRMKFLCEMLAACEAYDQADRAMRDFNIGKVAKNKPPDKLLINCYRTDSGGSTHSQRVFIGHEMTANPLHRPDLFVLWFMRCRIHHGAICAHNATDFFLYLCGINPKVWEKRSHLSAVTLRAKRAEIQVAHSLFLVNSTDLVPDSSASRNEDLSTFLKGIRVPESRRHLLRRVLFVGEHDDRRALIPQGKAKDTHTAIISAGAAVVKPVWSRWLTFTTFISELLLCMLFGIGVVAGRFFGSQYKLKDDAVQNHTIPARRVVGILHGSCLLA